jgi:hypothetical protein
MRLCCNGAMRDCFSFIPERRLCSALGTGEHRPARRLNAQPPVIICSQAGTRRRDPDPAETHLLECAVVSVPEHHHDYLLRGRSYLPLLPALSAGVAAG